jgi:hypothetical protein
MDSRRLGRDVARWLFDPLKIDFKQGLYSLILFLAFGIMGRYLSLTDEGPECVEDLRLGSLMGAELFIEVD